MTDQAPFLILESMPFEMAERGSHAQIQHEFGEAWTHIPCLKPKPNFQAQPDPARPAYAISAIFEWDAVTVHLGTEETGVSSRKPSLTILAGCLRYPVQAQDRFQRCVDGLLFQATDRQPDSLSGVEVPLVQMGRQP